MIVEARLAGTADIAALALLAASASEEKISQRGGELWDTFDKSDYTTASAIDLVIADPTALIGVGTIDGVLVGFCTARLHQPIRSGRPLAQLDSIFVEPEAREVGVGEALMSLVVDWATTMDCRGIDSIAMPGDRATKNFFESFGLVARAIRVHRVL